MKNQSNEIPAELYTAEAAEAAEQSRADLKVEDPEDGVAAIRKLLNQESED